MIELANRKRRRGYRSIDNIPEFRAHLAREGITMAEFEARQRRQTIADLDGEALRLQRRRVALNAHN